MTFLFSGLTVIKNNRESQINEIRGCLIAIKK